MPGKDCAKSQELSQEEQKAAEKMVGTDITKNIPLSSNELEALKKLMGEHGVILNSSNGEVHVIR